MPQIDNVKRINVEDFPSKDRETVERIANNYNFFAEQVTNVLNGQVDFDNLNRSLVELDVTTNTNGVPINTTKFSAEVGLIGTKVIRADNLTNKINFVTGAPFIVFSASGSGTYTIEKITGLIANNKYRIAIELIF